MWGDNGGEILSPKSNWYNSLIKIIESENQNKINCLDQQTWTMGPEWYQIVEMSPEDGGTRPGVNSVAPPSVQ